MTRQFHIGAQNDALFIISGERPATTNDYPRHDADRTCIAKVYDKAEARRLVDAANAGLASAPQASQPAQGAEPPADWEAAYRQFADGPAFGPEVPALKKAFAAGMAWQVSQSEGALRAIMRAADAAKEPCGMDPESPAAVRNGKFATIAQIAAQGLGLVRGPALAAPPQGASSLLPDVTDEMVAAYLKANDAYWKEQDSFPLKNPSTWRNGTAKEATLVSLRAALASSPVPAPQAALCWIKKDELAFLAARPGGYRQATVYAYKGEDCAPLYAAPAPVDEPREQGASWISVEDRLPPTDSHVWTWDGATVRSDSYWTRYDGVERFCCDEGFGVKTTHWMLNARPQPPNADAAVQNVAEASMQDGPESEHPISATQPASPARVTAEEQACRPNGLMFDALGEPRTRYVRVTLDGSHCVMHPSEGDTYIADARANGDESAYQVADVYLSEREFDDLPEFDGF